MRGDSFHDDYFQDRDAYDARSCNLAIRVYSTKIADHTAVMLGDKTAGEAGIPELNPEEARIACLVWVKRLAAILEK